MVALLLQKGRQPRPVGYSSAKLAAITSHVRRHFLLPFYLVLAIFNFFKHIFHSYRTL
jgi:hypothetical protein